MDPDDAKGELILLAPRRDEAEALEREFVDALKGFGPRDLYVVARLLERLQYISIHQGPDAALSVIDRLLAREWSLRR